MEQTESYQSYLGSLRIAQIFIRLLCLVGIFGVTVFFTPNFKLSSFPILLISTVATIFLDYVVSVITGIHDMPLGRALVGFTTAAIIIYLTQFIVDGYYLSIISSLIAAAIYGVVDFMLTNK